MTSARGEAKLALSLVCGVPVGAGAAVPARRERSWLFGVSASRIVEFVAMEDESISPGEVRSLDGGRTRPGGNPAIGGHGRGAECGFAFEIPPGVATVRPASSSLPVRASCTTRLPKGASTWGGDLTVGTFPGIPTWPWRASARTLRWNGR